MNDRLARTAVRNSVREGVGWQSNLFAGSHSGSYSGVNTTRQDKYQARERRRWGDSAYWGIPAPVLWLEDSYAMLPFDDIVFVAPEFVDIWA